MDKCRNGETICWTCRRSTNSGCPWSARFQPVPGWTAERRDILSYDGEKYIPTESYRVSVCPLYLEDRREPKCPKWDGPYWDAPLCRACWSRRICMETHGTCNGMARS